MLLKDVFEYSLEEIAELVDSTVGGVKAALNRGRSKLASLEDRLRSAARLDAREQTDPSALRRTIQPPRLGRAARTDQRRCPFAGCRSILGQLRRWGYLGVYSRMRVTWRLTLGEVDGEPSIILLNLARRRVGNRRESSGSISARTAGSSGSPIISTARGLSPPDPLWYANGLPEGAYLFWRGDRS